MNHKGNQPDVTVHSVTLATPVVGDFVYRRVYDVKVFIQWRIQDFPDGRGHQPLSLDQKLFI